MARIKQLWMEVKTSFWFVPALIIIFLIILAIAIIEVDQILAASERTLPITIVSFQQESIRTFLATIAGSMMTLAGVVFSITILVLAQAAGQYSSRILRNFMKKKANQVILGIFVGIFIFCLFLLTNLHPTDNALTAVSGFILALVGVGFLIYYIHQTSISIQASEILRSIYEETTEAIEDIYPEQSREPPSEIPFLEGHHLVSKEVGFLQGADWDALVKVGAEYGTQIEIKKRIGEFIAVEEELFRIGKDLSEDKNFENQLRRALVIGKDRTAAQDVMYGVQQTVDIALRGISPGVNDLSTTQTAIDYLTSILMQLANRYYGSHVLYYQEKPILFRHTQTFSTFLEQSFEGICANAKTQPTIQKKINEAIEKIDRVTEDPKRKELLKSYFYT